MDLVELRGELVCANPGQAAIVREHLPRHTALTRAEAGCELFDVDATDDPLIWRVHERFRDPDAFRAHQQRVGASEWGRATAAIERRYTVTGL